MKVLVALPWGLMEQFRPLTDAGHEVVLLRQPGSDQFRRYDDEELIERCRDVDVLMTSGLSRRVVEAAPSLRAVVTPTIGFERVEVAAATEQGVLVCNSPSPENFIGVAEAAIGFFLALAKNLRHAEALLRSGAWSTDADRGTLLWQRTAGIVGFGRIGREVAKRLATWDMRLLAYDPYVPAETARALGVTLVDLPTLLRESDFVTIHVLVTEETRGLIGEGELRQMKPAAFLVNTSRGEVIDEAALVKAIREKWIAGVALDVFEPEPLPHESELRGLDPERVILTPHNISHSPESREGNLRLALESVLTILRGEAPATVVNREAIPRWQARSSGKSAVGPSTSSG